MALNKLIVRKLFNTFDYEINLENKDIVIIIGENGVGKTTLLKIIDGVLSNKLQYLFSIVFGFIELYFSSTVWRITKAEDKLVIKDKATGNSFSVLRDDQEERMQLFHKILSNEDSIASDKLYRESLSTYYNLNHLSNILDDTRKTSPEWFDQIIKGHNIIFIRTQRLYRSTYKEGRKSNSLEHMVNIYSKELVDILKQDNAKFMAASVQLDSTFPKRLLEERTKNKYEGTKKIIDEINNLYEYRNLLSSVGIINTQNDDFIKDSLAFLNDSNSLPIFDLYIKDSKRKLNVFQETASKLKLLCEIINKRFKHKRLFIDKKEGFLIRPEGKAERKIEITDLSSGEQNELIIFYQLLFKTKKGALVLIDEPEISLHIVWQQQLVGDMAEIAKETGIKLVIATHSPDIIGDNWRLVQYLGEQ